MMTLKFSNCITVLLGTVSLIIVSCVDEFDNFTPFANPEKISSLLNPADNTQSVTFNNDSGITFSTDRFTTITIPADAFDINGSDTSVEIEFRYLEIYSKGDKIKYNVPTISGGELIASDGVYYFEAFAGGTSLRLRSGIQIKVETLNDNPNFKMELFYGEFIEQDRFNWIEADDDRNMTRNVRVVEAQDSTGEILIGYEFFTDSLRWINVDVFVDIPKEEKTEVCIELPEIYNNQNTTVYMVFHDYNSVVALHADEGSSKFCEPYKATPIGANVTFVVISKQGEEIYHFGIEEATITSNYISDMFPQETSMSAIISALDNL